ncbi:putative glycosyl transferase [Mycobacterium kansasii]|uniref:Putative glycosyl transferase n=1 Tax=Mycobacterium kansasii TaxID=1768 RepID=A0A1V3XD82_MYCKA|nr:putative glycosyl transferase [Mycobacterium kansasii]
MGLQLLRGGAPGGDYHVEDRQRGARNLSGQKYERDRDLLLAEVERDPGDARSVFYLAQSYYDLGDFANARTWYARRAEMAGWAEETYYAMWRVAVSMGQLNEPWPDVRDAYLRAWEFRPTRAEPLFAIAARYRADGCYQLGYEFAKRAAEIPFPEQDMLFVRADIYDWRIVDEQAVCASWIGKYAEAFTLWRRLLTRSDLPENERQRIAENRDICAPTMVEAASTYPDPELLASVQPSSQHNAGVVVSLVAGRTSLPLSRHSTRFYVAAPTSGGSDASWSSMPACPARIAKHYAGVTNSSTLFASALSSGRSAPRLTAGSGYTWTGAGDSSRPKT